MPLVFVSILNFNGKKDTIACLKSLEKINKESFDLKVLVIDNASKEKFDLPQLDNLQVGLIKNDKNLGFSGGHNIGIDHALKNGADYVLILNNDTTVDKNLITRLLNCSKDAGIVAPKIYFYPGSEFHKGRYTKSEEGKVFWYAGGVMDWANVIGHHRGVDDVDHGQYDLVQSTDFASGCCMLVKKDVFAKIGLFDEKYFLYYEDNDLSQRARKAKFKIVYCPEALLWHKNAGSVGGSGSTLQDYYITRNRMLFGMRFAPLRPKFSLIRESLRLLTGGRSWQKKGILDFYMGKFGKGSYSI